MQGQSGTYPGFQACKTVLSSSLVPFMMMLVISHASFQVILFLLSIGPLAYLVKGPI